MNYTFTSRPVNTVWFSARYRQYEFDNRTVPFEVGNSVNYDTTIVALNAGERAVRLRRATRSTPTPPILRCGTSASAAGYTREEVDRTYRIVEKTTEDIGRVSVDLTGLPLADGARRVRARASAAGRRWTGSSCWRSANSRCCGSTTSPIATRIASRRIIMVTPVSQFSVNTSASASAARSTRARTSGCGTTTTTSTRSGSTIVPSTRSRWALTYGFEKYTALQASRTANPLPANTVAFLNDPTQQFNDPRRDWTDDSADRVHTFDASMDLLKLLPRTDIKVAYDYSRARVDLHLRAGGQHGHRGAAAALAGDQRAAARDGRRPLLPDPALRASALVVLVRQVPRGRLRAGPGEQPGAAGRSATPTLMMLGYFYRPYTANTVMARMTYLW